MFVGKHRGRSEESAPPFVYRFYRCPEADHESTINTKTENPLQEAGQGTDSVVLETAQGRAHRRKDSSPACRRLREELASSALHVLADVQFSQCQEASDSQDVD